MASKRWEEKAMFKRRNWEEAADRNVLDLNYTSVNGSSVEVTPEAS